MSNNKMNIKDIALKLGIPPHKVYDLKVVDNQDKKSIKRAEMRRKELMELALHIIIEEIWEDTIHEQS